MNRKIIPNSSIDFRFFAKETGGDDIEVQIDSERETIWLSQDGMADLFDCSSENVGLHLNQIYAERKLEEAATAEDLPVVRQEGSRTSLRTVKHYNLDAVIAVGDRVNSKRASAFRQWASDVLRDSVVAGKTLEHEALKAGLNGMFWDVGAMAFDIPSIGGSGKAVFIYQQNRAAITWHALSTLERNPTTLSQTAAILNGCTVDVLDSGEVLQVANYGKASSELMRLIRNDDFELTAGCASHLHGFVGKEDALTWGTFRTGNVGLQGCRYAPPDAGSLPEIAAKGFEFLETQISDPKERAFALFLFMCRNQFFYDANKRTASVMMNGALMRDGFHPVTVMNRDADEFHEKLGRFYETGDANAMMRFFQKQVATMYPPKEKLPKVEKIVAAWNHSGSGGKPDPKHREEKFRQGCSILRNIARF